MKNSKKIYWNFDNKLRNSLVLNPRNLNIKSNAKKGINVS